MDSRTRGGHGAEVQLLLDGACGALRLAVEDALELCAGAGLELVILEPAGEVEGVCMHAADHAEGVGFVLDADGAGVGVRVGGVVPAEGGEDVVHAGGGGEGFVVGGHVF